MSSPSSSRPLVVIVVGQTGAGKSTLIKEHTGADIQTGKSSTHVTRQENLYPDKCNERIVWLDTLGLDIKSYGAYLSDKYSGFHICWVPLLSHSRWEDELNKLLTDLHLTNAKNVLPLFGHQEELKDPAKPSPSFRRALPIPVAKFDRSLLLPKFELYTHPGSSLSSASSSSSSSSSSASSSLYNQLKKVSLTQPQTSKASGSYRMFKLSQAEIKLPVNKGFKAVHEEVAKKYLPHLYSAQTHNDVANFEKFLLSIETAEDVRALRRSGDKLLALTLETYYGPTGLNDLRLANEVQSNEHLKNIVDSRSALQAHVVRVIGAQDINPETKGNYMEALFAKVCTGKHCRYFNELFRLIIDTDSNRVNVP